MTSTPWEKLERLKVEADRWLAGVSGSLGDAVMMADASRGIRELIDKAHHLPSERGLTDEATKLAEQWKERADDAGRLSRAVLTQPDVIAQVERALRKNPLIAMFLDQGFWHAHHVDIVIRHDGQDRRYEADWITELWYIVRRRGLSVTDAVKADQEGVAGGQSDPR